MSQVILEVYDLSGGMASAMSQQLLGQRIDGIWHTGLLVFNREYYFGGGIQVALQGQFAREHRMAPVQSIVMGITTKVQSELESFLREIGPRFTQSTYDLLRNNCNNFSNVVCNFLLGIGIPSYIIDLPNTVFSTPMGAMLRPMIEGMQNNIVRSQGSGMDPFGRAGESTASKVTGPSLATAIGQPLAVVSSNVTTAVALSIPPMANLEERALVSGDATTIQSMGDKLLNTAGVDGIAGSALLEEEKAIVVQIVGALKDATSRAAAGATTTIIQSTDLIFSTASYGVLESLMERFPTSQMCSLFILRLMVLHDSHPSSMYARIIRSVVARLKTAMSSTNEKDLVQKQVAFSGIPAQVMALCALSNLLSHASGVEFLFNNGFVKRVDAASAVVEAEAVAEAVAEEGPTHTNVALISSIIDIAVGNLSHVRCEVRQLSAAIVYNVVLLCTQENRLSGPWAPRQHQYQHLYDAGGHTQAPVVVDPSVLHPQALHILCGCIENILSEQDAVVRRRTLAVICRIMRTYGAAASQLLDDLGVLTPGAGLHALHQELLLHKQQQHRGKGGGKGPVEVAAEDELTIISEILSVAQRYK